MLYNSLNKLILILQNAKLSLDYTSIIRIKNYGTRFRSLVEHIQPKGVYIRIDSGCK